MIIMVTHILYTDTNMLNGIVVMVENTFMYGMVIVGHINTKMALTTGIIGHIITVIEAIYDNITRCSLFDIRTY